MTRIEEIDLEMEKVYDELHKLDNGNLEKSFEEYESRRAPYYSKLNKLSREQRLLMIPEFSEIPDYGDVMTLKQFVSAVKNGMFIDSDGSGNYARDGKMSNISIHPSDVPHNALRTDFDTVVWFNK